jgi:hypothetical protein
MDTLGSRNGEWKFGKRPIYSCRAHIATSFVPAAIVTGIWLGCWLLVPNRCLLNVAFHVRGYREPKLPKRDFVSNGWRRQRNRCGKLVEEASVNSRKDSLDERVGKKRLKNNRKENNLK